MNTTDLSNLGYLNTSQLAREMGKARTTIIQYIKKGLIKGYQLEGFNGTYYRMDDIVNQIKNKMVTK